jgi:hypothetical protein
VPAFKVSEKRFSRFAFRRSHGNGKGNNNWEINLGSMLYVDVRSLVRNRYVVGSTLGVDVQSIVRIPNVGIGDIVGSILCVDVQSIVRIPNVATGDIFQEKQCIKTWQISKPT